MDDSVAVDAKRILLRYGAPIAVLDRVPETKRIEFARTIAKTSLPERENALQKLLVAEGFMDASEMKLRKPKKSRKSRKSR